MNGTPTTELAGKLVVGLAGVRLEEAERRWLKSCRPAGVILFRRNVESSGQLAALCHELHEVLPAGAEIMADQEGGRVSVLEAATGRPPAPYALGVINDLGLTYDVFRDSGWLARKFGIDRLLSPCADVLSEPLNPIIGSRAFGGDPQMVSRHVVAAVCGLRDSGVSVCLKHWPGHGGTVHDTHQRSADNGPGFYPGVFAAGLGAGADGVMVGHVDVSPGHRPASLDAATVSSLRRICPPSVLTFSDDLTMGALRTCLQQEHGLTMPGSGMIDPSAVSLAWLQAMADSGLDRLLVRGIPWSAFATEAEPVETGYYDAAYNRHFARAEINIGCGPGKGSGKGPESWRWSRERMTRGIDFPESARILLLDAEEGPGGDARSEALRHGLGLDPSRVGVLDQAALKSLPVCDLLVVTSQRPASRSVLEDLASAECTPGVCIAMGHPALAGQLTSSLGPDWRVVPVYDVSTEDLAAFFEFKNLSDGVDTTEG